MLPITVDLGRLRVVLVGNGTAACRRLALLDLAGAGQLEVYAAAPVAELAEAAGSRLRRRWPQADEIARAQLVFLAAVGEPVATRLRQVADSAGILMNVEDDLARSDFHSPAVVRRGDLIVAISTGGRCPGLAAAIRRQLEACFGREWGARLEGAAALRRRWRMAGEDHTTIARKTQSWLDRAGGLALTGE